MKKRYWIIFAILLVLSCFTVSYSSNEVITFSTFPEEAEDGSPSDEAAQPDLKPGEAEVIDSNNRFALDLYTQLKSDEGNIFFSPYSISMVLSILSEGARGKTADEFKAVFHQANDATLRRDATASIFNQLTKPRPDYILTMANALWAQQGHRFRSDYLDITKKYYDGKIFNIDFVNEPDNAANIINDWIEDNTNNKIHDAVDRNEIDNTTQLIVTNAIYFKATWETVLKKIGWFDQDFRVDRNKVVKSSMMGETEHFGYYRDRNFLNIIELPYTGDAMSMLILFPVTNDLPAVEKELTLENLKKWRSKIECARLEFSMPKFTFRTGYSLEEILSKMGLGSAFGNSADFSGIDGTKSLFIQQFKHQTFVDVNEKGTEAAAVTHGTLGCAAAPPEPVVVTVDHPFIFLIQDMKNGNILFIGRVIDPTQKA
ncbi:MAG: serpin family protein [Deltaproteobacteria bacterium]|nr:serpin family protein [Deltaproteobacteria bacterium]